MTRSPRPSPVSALGSSSNVGGALVRGSLVASALVAGVALGGCRTVAVDPADAQVVADGSQAMMASAQSLDLANNVFTGVSVTDPVSAVAQLAGPAKLPALSCVTRALDAANPGVVHVTFHDCTGPFGLVHIDGEEVVTLGPGPDGALEAKITSVDLTAGGKPVTHSATADITFPSPTTRTVVWTGDWTRIDDLGETVAHTSDLQITVDLAAECTTSSGSARTTVASREVDTTINQYKLCRDVQTGAVGCPSGSVVHTGKVSDRTVSISYDDSAVAEVTGPRGDSYPVDMVCTSIGR